LSVTDGEETVEQSFTVTVENPHGTGGPISG